ncbi:hypothetical protein EVAR_74907_1 [Eumeta japonica]|uniref:Uncharacterized protein n=1 Tax=Eumeta variegata TaxID=151549 RepID=A0A4C1UI94_EUMVA|nr:hypothetical protein EVAR_74907_1 [Eumeta japonica]
MQNTQWLITIQDEMLKSDGNSLNFGNVIIKSLRLIARSIGSKLNRVDEGCVGAVWRGRSGAGGATHASCLSNSLILKDRLALNHKENRPNHTSENMTLIKY